MSVWSDLYDLVNDAEQENGGPLTDVRKDPTDDDSDLYTQAEIALLKTKLRIYSEMEKRRGYKKFQTIAFIQRARRDFEKTKTYSSDLHFIFLQYIGILMKWAMKRYDLSQKELELILYLYPAGIFDQAEFYVMAEALGLEKSYKQILQRLKRKEMVEVWEDRKGEEKIYSLTERARNICHQMHRIALGKEKIAESRMRNPLATFRDSVYNRIFKKMNSRVED